MELLQSRVRTKSRSYKVIKLPWIGTGTPGRSKQMDFWRETAQPHFFFGDTEQTAKQLPEIINDHLDHRIL